MAEKSLFSRKEFPLLNNNPNYIYVDNAATTQKPNCVIDKIIEFYTTYNSNVHRGVHDLSEKATDQYELVRESIANYMNCEKNEVVYTYGTTHGINLLANGFKHLLKQGDEIVISAMEHHANIIPWQELCKSTGSTLRVIPVTGEGRLDYEKAKEIISKKTKILSITHASNVLGTKNDIKSLISMSRTQNPNLFSIVDGAQEIVNGVDVKELNCDAYVFSAHKLFGPTGVGAVYISSSLQNRLSPLIYGGSMIEDVEITHSTYTTGPQKFEAGTPPIAQVIGMGRAIEYVQTYSREEREGYKTMLTDYFLSLVKELGENITIYGPHESSMRNPVFSFSLKNIHHFDLTKFLDEYNIAVRSGHHCAIPLHKELGVDGTTRVSLTFYNTKEDIDIIIKSLKEIIRMFS